MIDYNDVQKVEIRIGEIISAEKIEKSDKLLLLSVDFGEETPRSVVSGIAPFFENPEELHGVQCSFVTNLEPRSLMGYESQAMILGAKTEEGFALLTPHTHVPVGAVVG